MSVNLAIMELEPNITVSGQIYSKDFELLSEKGIKAIVNMRPDQEEIGQPLSLDLGKQAQFHHIKWYPLYIRLQTLGWSDLNEFYQIMDQTSYPLHLFCKSGMRTVYVWALTHALIIKTRYLDQELIKIAMRAGFNIKSEFEQLKTRLLST